MGRDVKSEFYVTSRWNCKTPPCLDVAVCSAAVFFFSSSAGQGTLCCTGQHRQRCIQRANLSPGKLDQGFFRAMKRSVYIMSLCVLVNKVIENLLFSEGLFTKKKANTL